MFASIFGVTNKMLTKFKAWNATRAGACEATYGALDVKVGNVELGGWGYGREKDGAFEIRTGGNAREVRKSLHVWKFSTRQRAWASTSGGMTVRTGRD